MEEAGDRSVARLGELAEAYWDASLLADPVQGTAIGDRRYNDRLPDITPAGRHYVAQSAGRCRRAHLARCGSRAAFVADPDGNVVELWTWDVAEHLREHEREESPGSN